MCAVKAHIVDADRLAGWVARLAFAAATLLTVASAFARVDAPATGFNDRRPAARCH